VIRKVHRAHFAGDAISMRMAGYGHTALGSAAFLIVVDEIGQVIFKHPIVIGES